MELVQDPIVVGIDVSKKTLDVAISDQPKGRPYPNTAAGFRELIAALAPYPNPLIVLEATGEYHIPLVEALEAAGHLTAICNPARIRAFAKAMGFLSKTDKADAKVLVAFGQARTPTPRPLLPPLLRSLQALLARREDCVGMRTMETNRQKATHDLATNESTTRIIATFKAEIKQLTQAIATLIANDPALAQRSAHLQTIPGFGPIVAAHCLVSMADLGTIPAKQLAALVGLAPYARDSGAFRGKRFIRGGRGSVRKALYQAVNAAVSTCRQPNQLKTIYQGLRTRGKPHNLAMVATMRRLLAYLTAMIRDNVTWSELAINTPHTTAETA